MMKDYSIVAYITEYRGELTSRCDTHYDYVAYGGFEKDYVDEWMNSLSDFPTLSEILEFCNDLDEDIRLWIDGVEAGVIDPEAGVEDEEE